MGIGPAQDAVPQHQREKVVRELKRGPKEKGPTFHMEHEPKSLRRLTNANAHRIPQWHKFNHLSKATQNHPTRP
jgi:hypothetical protein